jgi:DNA-binding LacI/PurR family transcriptional regulator
MTLTLDRLLKRPEPPTAFVVAKPAHVLTLVSHLLRRGVRLPEEAVVLSRDDEPFLAHMVPTVARYAADQARFARRASKLVIEMLRGGSRQGPLSLFTPRFIPGETLG